MSNFVQILPERAELFQADRRRDVRRWQTGRKYDEANSGFPLFCNRA